MKINFLRTFVKCCFISFVGYQAYLYACASDWGYYYNSIFSPEIASNTNTYTPLFYDDAFLFYNNSYIDRESYNYENKDISDWENYLGKNLSQKAIKYFMYDKESALADISKYNASSDKNRVRLSQYSPSNSNQKVQNFFTFLGIARGNEHITNATYDPWDYENRKIETTQQNEINKVEKLYNSIQENDSFFANRIWFQLVRLKFYSNNRSSVISFFNETQNIQPKNSLYYRALHYVAGAYIAQKNYAKANAILAKLFNTEPQLIQSTIFEYKPLTDNEINKIASTLPPDEQCALWALQGYYTSEVNAMQKILSINSQSPHIDFLLTRYINKIESKINVFSYDMENINSIKAYRKFTKDIITKNFNTDWILKTAKEGKTANPFLWNVAAGYVSTFKNEYSEADFFLKKAENQAKNANQKNQALLLEVFNDVSSIQKIDNSSENKLLKKLEWLWNNLYDESYPSNQDNTLRYNYTFAFIRKYISALYETEKNTLMAEITNPEKGFFKNNNSSLAMENFLLKKDKTPWESFWAKYYNFSLGDIYESRSIYLFYEDKIDEAIASLEKTPLEDIKIYDLDGYITKKIKLSDTELPANPFNGKIKDCNDCEHAIKQKVKYTKLSFLKKVKEMQENIKQGKDVYNNALLLGNAFYNASYFGSIRAFYYNKIINEYSYIISKDHYSTLLSMENAKKYYLLAQKNAQTDEQKAKIAYMLAKVERNEYYNEEYYYKGENEADENKAFRNWKGFQELKKYPNTQYYKEVIKECEYFKKVVKK